MAQPFPNELKHLYDNAEFIGSGGFARVFKARRKDGRVVAVKIPLSLDEATGKSFLREITSWQRLAHKNIVSLFDANILPIPYLEQEYCDGGSLESLKKPLEITKACEIVFDIAEGLKYAHKQGIVHRDLKPQNILLTKDNVPKITDWGMSRVIAESRSSTQHGYTPAYASPEQVSPKKFGKPDERTDIYQLGVIFYNLLTNDLPFKGDDLAEIASAIVMEKPATPSEVNPKAKEVEHVVLKCLSKNKEERYQSVEELQRELAGFVKQRKEREKKALEKLQQETVRREKEKERERLRKAEREEREAREEAEKREIELQKAKQEEERLRKQREEQERIAREKEEPTRKEPEGTSWKGVFAVALVLGALLLGIWALAPGATNAPETTKPTPNPLPPPIIITLPPDIQKTITNSIGMEFVLIPAGEFNMGSPENEKDRFSSEGPVHRVKISQAFYMGRYEVTQKQWREVIGNNPSYFKGDDLPVEQVSWNDVQEFIKKLNEKEGTYKYRLPSEAEWEYAARAGTTTRYSFGDDESKLGEYAWYDANSGSKTHDVGQKKPNPWGLYDMHGNVWEWMQDVWHDNYNGAPTDGSAWEGDGSSRVLRGGSWINYAGYCRSAFRDVDVPGSRGNGLSFRLLRTP